MSFDSREFRNAVGTFATGVTLITVKDGEEVHAMTANSFSSVSLEPPIISVCIDYRAKCLDLITDNGYFGVNILKDEQIDISKFFAKQKIEQEPSFEFDFSKEGAPLYKGALVNLNCKVVKEVVIGDHTVFFGEVIAIKTDEGSPLCFYKGQYRQLARESE